MDEGLNIKEDNKNQLSNVAKELFEISEENNKKEKEEEEEDSGSEKDNEIRRYNEQNIDEGKKFFKNRFIEKLKLQKLAKKVQDIKTIQTRLSFSIDKTELIRKEEERKEIKFSSLFTNKADKAIFSFNIKKYDNSYQELLNIGIIDNSDEFAEFILTYPGFDKSIIGDFLAKEKSLNKGFVILKAYMKHIDFRNVNFLDSLRFLLKRMNLPSDSGLILGIIDEYTKVYYDDNKNNNNFKSSDNLYLLASTLLALNTMFTRKDIKNMNVIKKEEFIKMNTDCNEDFLSKIYDELHQNPIVMNNDYLELIYKRDAIQGRATNAFPTQEGEIQEEIVSEEQILESLESMKKGAEFSKYGTNYSDTHPRFFQLSADSKYFIWYDPGSCKLFRQIRKIAVADFKNVYIGINSSKLFEKANIPLSGDQQCMNIICKSRNIALRNENEAITKKWYYGIKYLINYNTNSLAQPNIDIGKKKYYDSESEMKISQLWKNEILLKWKHYRKYLSEDFDRKEIKKIKQSSSKKIEINQENENEEAEEIYDKYMFFDFWKMGLPKFLRKKMWPIIIGNRAGITENLVEYYTKTIEQIDFFKLNRIYKEYLSTQTEKGDEIAFSEDILMNQIINDILKIINTKYVTEIANLKMRPEDFALDLFKTIRIFTLYRQDIIYSKEIAYISAIFLLNSENYYQALVNMVNFILDSPGIKFIQKNEEFISIRTSFWKSLLSKYFPRLNKHLIKLDLSPEMYFNKWISFFYIKALPYDVLLKLWDNYIVRGEIFLFEIAIAILKIQENDCLGLPSGKILQNLKKIPLKTKYSEEEFFKVLYRSDISKDYEYIEETDLGYEKAILLQSYMNDKV